MCAVLFLGLHPASGSRAEAAPPEKATATGATNVSGTELQVCSTAPMTGWFRDGHCRTDARDRGIHVVCAQVTDAFLQYSKAQGNDLITSSPEHRFPGLEPGDRWCLCAARYREAVEAGVGPPVLLEATHQKALKYLSKEVLQKNAVRPKDAP